MSIETYCACGEVVLLPGTSGLMTSDGTRHRYAHPCLTLPEMGPLDHLDFPHGGEPTCGAIHHIGLCTCARHLGHTRSHICGEPTCGRIWP